MPEGSNVEIAHSLAEDHHGPRESAPRSRWLLTGIASPTSTTACSGPWMRMLSVKSSSNRLTVSRMCSGTFFSDCRT